LWWPSKSAVVLDVLVADNTQDGDPLPIPDSGDLAADLRSVLVETVAPTSPTPPTTTCCGP
jgi:hypothetical protein